MEEKIELLSEFLTQQLNHWILFPLALTIMGLTSRYTAVPRPDLLMWAVCGLFPVVFYFLRTKISRFPFFVLSHTAAVCLSLAVPAQGTANRVICIVCGIYYMVHSFALRIKDVSDTPMMHPFISMGISPCPRRRRGPPCHRARSSPRRGPLSTVRPGRPSAG